MTRVPGRERFQVPAVQKVATGTALHISAGSGGRAAELFQFCARSGHSARPDQVQDDHDRTRRSRPSFPSITSEVDNVRERRTGNYWMRRFSPNRLAYGTVVLAWEATGLD